MDTNLFSQINTTIATKDAAFISAEQFSKLLQITDKESLAVFLQSTPYALSAEELDDLTIIDNLLMKKLSTEYDWVFEEAPEKSIVALFSLRYVYHNIKVLLKAKATGLDLSYLLIPIGQYSLDVLTHLVMTFDSEYFPQYMIDELRDIWTEYEDYKDIRVLEIGVDLAYFKHFKKLAEQTQVDALEQLATVTIDFYNVITVKRALQQKNPRSFMLQLISDAGSMTASELLDIVENGNLLSWFHQMNPNSFSISLTNYEEKIRQGTISIVELEYLSDLMQYQLLDQARYDSQGPLVLARYLLGCEFEVKNLRMFLSAISNNIPLATIKERMRPIYGQ